MLASTTEDELMSVIMTYWLKGPNPDAAALRALLTQEFAFGDPRVAEMEKHYKALDRITVTPKARERYEALLDEAENRLNAEYDRQGAHFHSGVLFFFGTQRPLKWGEFKRWLRSEGIPFDMEYDGNDRPMAAIKFRNDADAVNMKLRWY
jgi:hypothetical protein